MMRKYTRVSFTSKIAFFVVVMFVLCVFAACGGPKEVPAANDNAGATGISEPDSGMPAPAAPGTAEPDSGASGIQWNHIAPDQASQSIQTNSIPIEIPQFYDIISYAGNGNGDAFYALGKQVSMGFIAETTSIFRCDMKGGTVETLKAYDTHNWISDLGACDNAVFWVFTDPMAQRIERYDLDTHTLSIVKAIDTSGSADEIISLTVSDDYIAWFEREIDGRDTYALYAMNISDGEIQTVTEDASSSQLHNTRACICDDRIAYVSGPSDSKIVTYDLNAKAVVSTVTDDSGNAAANPQANKDYLLWEELPPDSNQDKTYMLQDFSQDKTYDLNLNSISAQGLFWDFDSTTLVGDSLYLIENGTKLALDKANLSNNTVMTLDADMKYPSWIGKISETSLLSIATDNDESLTTTVY